MTIDHLPCPVFLGVGDATRLPFARSVQPRELDKAAARLAVANAVRAASPRAKVSYAHSAGRAVAAAARRSEGCSLGIDLEPLGAASDAELRYFATLTEAALAETIGATAVWCLKEAAWKALRCRPATRFHSLALELDGAQVTGVRLDGERHPGAAALLQPWRGWIAAIVVLDGCPAERRRTA